MYLTASLIAVLACVCIPLDELKVELVNQLHLSLARTLLVKVRYVSAI